MQTLTALGIFLAGAAVGGLTTVILFSNELRGLRRILEDSRGNGANPGPSDGKTKGTDDRDAA